MNHFKMAANGRVLELTNKASIFRVLRFQKIFHSDFEAPMRPVLRRQWPEPLEIYWAVQSHPLAYLQHPLTNISAFPQDTGYFTIAVSCLPNLQFKA